MRSNKHKFLKSSTMVHYKLIKECRKKTLSIKLQGMWLVSFDTRLTRPSSFPSKDGLGRIDAASAGYREHWKQASLPFW